MAAVAASAIVGQQVTWVVTRARIDWGASAVIFAGVLALIVDMFFVWVKVSVHTADAFGLPVRSDLQVTGPGWASWGIVAGVLSIILVLWHLRSLRKRKASVASATVTAVLAAATAGFTAWQALTGEANVIVDGALSVTVTRQWPAEAAIALTAAVAAAAATRLATAAIGARRQTAGRAHHQASGSSLPSGLS
jgi:hypothetical protein